MITACEELHSNDPVIIRSYSQLASQWKIQLVLDISVDRLFRNPLDYIRQ